MKLLLDLLQGAGLAGAAGVRPFLPTIVAGGMASGDVLIDFDGTDFSFLESPWFLLAVVAALVATVAARGALERGPGEAAVAGIGLGLGALLCAASIDDRHDAWWWALPVGLACGALAAAAVSDLLARTRGRLDAEAAAALPIYAHGLSAVLAVLVILAPPLAIAALVLFAWLLAGGRRREDEKYAGLRILR